MNRRDKPVPDIPLFLVGHVSDVGKVLINLSNVREITIKEKHTVVTNSGVEDYFVLENTFELLMQLETIEKHSLAALGGRNED